MLNMRVAGCLAGIAVLAGCATTQGTSFDRHKALAVVPGDTTKTQVLAVLGKPWHEQTYTTKKDMADKDLVNPAIISELRYYYADRQTPGKPADAEAARNAFYTFNGGKLMSYWVISTFPDDSTEFDEQLVSKLVKGKTNEQEVLALWGQPAGRGIYPAAQQADGSSLIYEVFLFRPKANQRTYKTLRIFLDRNRTVTDYELNVRSR